MFNDRLWKNWTIGTRIGIVTSTGILTIVLLIAAWTCSLLKKEHIATFSKQQFATAQAFAMYLDGDLSNKLRAIKAVADAVPPDTVLESSAQQFLSARAGTLSLFDDGLLILSAEGRLLAEMPFISLDRQGKDYSSHPFYQQARTIGRPVISEPFFSDNPVRRPIVEFMSPIHDAAGKISGYLCGGLTLNGDNSLGGIARKKVGVNGFLYIYSKDRTIVVHHDTTKIMQKGTPLGANQLFDLALRGFNGSGEAINASGLPFITSFSHLRMAPWILAANTPSDEALAPFYSSQKLIILTSILCAMGIILLSCFSLFFFTAPLQRFIVHMKELQGDTTIEHDSSPEIRYLSAAFHDMHVKLLAKQAELSANHELQRTFLNVTSDIIYTKDAQGCWLLANEAAQVLFQLQDVPFHGKNNSELALYSPFFHDFFISSATTDEQAWEQGSLLTTEDTIRTPDNGSRIYEMTRTPLFQPDGERKILIVTGRDITASKANEEEVRKFSRIVEQSPVSIVITDSQGNVEFINPHFTRLTGYTIDEIMGRNLRVLKTNQNPPEIYELLWQTISSGKIWEGEFCNKKKNGDLFTEHAIISPIFNKNNEISHYIAIKEDITAKKQSEQTIWRQTNFDALTQLPNRQLFLYRLENAIPYTKRDTSSLALLFLDLDNFKKINDTLGHDYGDLLLAEAAHRIQSCVRDTDTVARFGGDEFVLLLTNANIGNGVNLVANKIITALNQPFYLNNEIVHISGSIGITSCPEDSTFVGTLLQNANRALNMAKNDGRNCWRSYTQVQQEAAQKEQHVEI